MARRFWRSRLTSQSPCKWNPKGMCIRVGSVAYTRPWDGGLGNPSSPKGTSATTLRSDRCAPLASWYVSSRRASRNRRIAASSGR